MKCKICKSKTENPVYWLASAYCRECWNKITKIKTKISLKRMANEGIPKIQNELKELYSEVREYV